MTALRAEAIQMINQFSEEKVSVVISFMKSLKNQGTYDRDEEVKKRMEAFHYLRNLSIRVPDDFDEKKELMEALDEKYGSAD